MRRRSFFLVVLTVLSAGVVGMGFPQAASAQGEDGENVGLRIIDALVLRPLSAGASCLATTVYLGTFPFTYVAGASKEAEKNPVEKPWRFTHGRSLGEIDRYRDDISETGGPSLSKPSTY